MTNGCATTASAFRSDGDATATLTARTTAPMSDSVNVSVNERSYDVCNSENRDIEAYVRYRRRR